MMMPVGISNGKTCPDRETVVARRLQSIPKHHFWEVTTIWMLLTTSLKGISLKFGGLVGMLSISGWVHYACDVCPHKERTRVCVCVCLCARVTPTPPVSGSIAQGHPDARCCLHCPLHLGPLNDECFRRRGDNTAPTAHQFYVLSYGCRRRGRAGTEGRERRPNQALTDAPAARTSGRSKASAFLAKAS